MRLLFGCLVVLVMLCGNGLVRSADEKVEIGKLPKPVTDALKERWPGARLVSAEKETEDGKTVYDVAFRFKGKNIEASVSPDGKIASFEIEIPVADMAKAARAALDAKYPEATYAKVEEVYKVSEGKEKMEEYEVSLTTADKKKLAVMVTVEGKITKP